MYKTIYEANAVLEGLSASVNISPAVKSQLEGEARFIRAFAYFHLVNLFGQVPQPLQTNYKLNVQLGRTGQSVIYDSIIKDITKSQFLLGEEYITTERVRPNKFAATALLARVQLYIGNWQEAEAAASEVIDQAPRYSLTDINDVFLANSTEAIWQLMPIFDYCNTLEGNTFIIEGYVENQVLSNGLVESFDVTDKRLLNWVGTFDDGTGPVYFPYKYKVKHSTNLTEYSMVLRLAEQFLIRAEARARQNNIAGAQDDIDMIRDRAGLGGTIAADEASLIEAIKTERRHELFTEWGHRWLDLKRWKDVIPVLSAIKPEWNSQGTLYPIPQRELNNAPQLKPQNEGY